MLFSYSFVQIYNSIIKQLFYSDTNALIGKKVQLLKVVFAISLFSLFSASDLFAQTSYTWNGSVSSAWNNNSNWTPNSGFPSTIDNAKIVSGTPNALVLGANYSITNFTMTSGILDLGGYSLTTSGTNVFTAGTVQNGTFSSSSSAATFNNTTFAASCAVNITSGTITINGGTFNGITNLVQNGATQVNGLGGATFAGTTTIECAGTANLMTNLGNTFNGTTQLKVSNTGYLLLENTGANNYNGNVTLTVSGSGNLRTCYKGNTTFNGNVFIENTGTGTINFCESTGTAILASTKTISVGGAGFSSGIVNLKSFTQTGTTSQLITLTGSGNLYFLTGTTFNGNLTTVSPRIFFNGATFNGTVNSTKNGSGNDASTGGNTFAGTTTILENNGSGYFMMGNGSSDIFNTNLTVNNTGSNYIYLAYNSAGNQFNGTTVLNNSASGSGSNYIRVAHLTGSLATFAGAFTVNQTATGNDNAVFIAASGTCTFNGAATLNNFGSGTKCSILVSETAGSTTFNSTLTVNNSATATTNNYTRLYLGGSTTFNGNIVLNNSSSIGAAGIYFGWDENYTGTGTLANTKTISAGASSFSNGILQLERFTQTGGTAQNITLSGTAAIYYRPNTIFNAALTSVSPQVYLNGSRFNGVTYIEKNGATDNAGIGGNTFNGVTTVKNTGTGYLMLGNGNTDNYNADMTFTNQGSSLIHVAYATAVANFNGNLIVNSSNGSGIQFGASTGSANLANTKTITVGATGFSAGTLLLRNFTQLGGIAQALTLTGTSILTLGSNSIFNGNVNFVSPQLYLNGITFNGTANLEKNGTTLNSSKGGNIFNGATTIKNSSDAIFRLNDSITDDFNDNATFIQTGTGALQPAYNINCTFSKNISTVGSTTSVVFAANNGRVTIDGSAAQAFNGDAAQKPIVRRLTMTTSGAAQLTLNVPVDISTSLTSGNLTMTTGNINTTSVNILTLADNTVTTTIGNSNSYVNGPMKYIMALNGTTTLYFPIGKSSDWRPVELTPTHNTSTAYTYTSELYNASAEALNYTLPPTVKNVSNVHYWHIDRTASSTDLISSVVRLYYSNNDGVTNYAGLKVVKNTLGAPTEWTDMGGTATANGVGSILSGTFPSFSIFTLGEDLSGGGVSPLPIQLLSFVVKPNGSKVDLKWVTASEINNDYFTIERTIDGVNYEVIATIKGNGNSTSVIDYTSVDNDPVNGISYYRLKQTDFDGHITYSELQMVSFETEIGNVFSLNIYPNPNNGTSFTMQINASTNSQIMVVLFDALGKEIFFKTVQTTENSKDLYTIAPSPKLSDGIYFIMVIADDKVYKQKLMVK